MLYQLAQVCPDEASWRARERLPRRSYNIGRRAQTNERGQHEPTRLDKQR